jgi:hypothetical protein
MDYNRRMGLTVAIGQELATYPTLTHKGFNGSLKHDLYDLERMLFFINMEGIEHTMTYLTLYESKYDFKPNSCIKSCDLIQPVTDFRDWQGEKITDGIIIITARMLGFPIRLISINDTSVLIGAKRRKVK